MAQKKEVRGSPDGPLVTLAKNIGATAGRVAGALGIATEKSKGHKVGKLVKQNKSRLPRRQKKAAQKAMKTSKPVAKTTVPK